MLRRLALLTRLAAPSDRVLLVGDDDLTSLCLHWLGYQKLTLVDFDAELLDIVRRESKKKVVTVVHDLRGAYRGSFPKLGKGFDLFITDPPYGPDGLCVFAGVGIGALAPGGHGVIVAPAERVAGSSVREPLRLAAALQSFVTTNGAALVDMEPNSQRSYHGTVSSMLVLRRVGRRAVDFSRLRGPKEFY
jgi:predicted methyltransferase